MAGGISNVASGVQTIDALLGLYHWSNVNLTYNFPDTASYYDASTYFTDGSVPGSPTFSFATFASVTPSLGAALDKAIASELMAVSLLNYTKVAPGADADSSFARASLFNDAETGTPPGGIGYYPGLVDRGGDAWFNVDQPRFNNVQVGNSAYFAVLHELGHTVGLKHGHGNDRPGPTMDILPDQLNSYEFSVMTYRRYVGAPDIPVPNDTQADSYPQSLMMLDIAAIQYMYGADFTTNAGSTVYSFSTTTGEMFVNGVGQGAPSGNRIFRTIWDGNGTDTYNLSNYTSDLSIDLAPGGWSNFHSGQLAQLSISNDIFAGGNVYNALQYNSDPRSLIENAIGGSGNDVIKGNSASNTLTGNGGNDQLFGFGGDDTLNGGNGNDTLFGGDGSDQLFGGAGNDRLDGGLGGDVLNGGADFDFVDYSAAIQAAYAFLAAPSSNSGAASGDTYAGIEGLIGTSFDDFLIGNDLDNELRGGAGNDYLVGQGGVDRLIGGAGDDHLYGGAGNDIFDFGKPTAGIDTIHDWQDFGKFQDVISLQGRGLDFSDLTIIYSRGSTTVYAPSDQGLQPIVIIQSVLSIGADDFIF
jgi:serralysin